MESQRLETAIQIIFFVTDIALRRTPDQRNLFGIERPFHNRGNARHQRLLGDILPFSNQRARGHERVAADMRTIENARTHANQALIFDDATVQNGGVAHGHITANDQGRFLVSNVQGRVILNVGALADANRVDIPTYDHIEPDAGVFTNFNITDDGCRGRDKNR